VTVDGGARARARLEDVAAAAGVSKSIASRILNDAPGLAVRPNTRARVLDAARTLGYRPHAAARGLRRSETGAFALVVPDLAMPVYARIVRGAFQRALERDVVVLIAEDGDVRQTDEVVVRLVRGGRIDGVVVASARPAHPLLGSLDRLGVPHVFVNRAVPGTGRSVTMDDERASAVALEHLVALGHRAIGHVAGPRWLDPAGRRAHAFLAVAATLALPAAPVEEGSFSERGGAEAAHRLLVRRPEVTAIYASSLAQGAGVLHAAWRLGRAVPAELSVISYDDMPLAEHLVPPLTTIRMPLAELGAAAVDALIDQTLGGAPHDLVVPTEPEVITRASSAGPRA
jgi:DNA-binding LacI/PurR family transcriptional regulator